MTSKYDPLGEFLKVRAGAVIPMSFLEIEGVIGSPLPPKAVNHPAWWSNNTSNNTMTKVWLDAGYRTEQVDIGARRLVFRRSGNPRDKVSATSEPSPPQFVAAPRQVQAPSGGLLSRIRAVLGGSVRVAPGVSLTEPTGESWDADS